MVAELAWSYVHAPNSVSTFALHRSGDFKFEVNQHSLTAFRSLRTKFHIYSICIGYSLSFIVKYLLWETLRQNLTGDYIILNHDCRMLIVE